jgi:hypothetical protein
VGQRIWLNEQGRSRDHESSDEGDQTRKQHDVAQEHTHTRASSSSVRAVWHPQKYGPCSPELKTMKIGKAFIAPPCFIPIFALLF